MDTERQRGTFFLWWFVPQNRSWCDKKTLPVLGRIGNSQKEAHQVATLFMMVEKCRAPEPARPQRCTQSIWHVNRLGTESPVGGYEEYRYDFRDSFWLGANKFYVPRFEQIKNIKKNILLLLLLYFYFIAGAFSFDLLTGMYFFSWYCHYLFLLLSRSLIFLLRVHSV